MFVYFLMHMRFGYASSSSSSDAEEWEGKKILICTHIYDEFSCQEISFNIFRSVQFQKIDVLELIRESIMREYRLYYRNTIQAFMIFTHFSIIIALNHMQFIIHYYANTQAHNTVRLHSLDSNHYLDAFHAGFCQFQTITPSLIICLTLQFVFFAS